MKIQWRMAAVIGWAAAVVMVASAVDERRIDVGGKNAGWTQGVNYTVWAQNQTFYVGDWLYFRFDKNAYDVLEVNETNYEKCNAENYITNITRGGRDVYLLKEGRPYYFICSKGYCYGGMKLAINVTKPPSSSPTPQINYAANSLFQSGGKFVNFPLLALAILVSYCCLL